MDEILKGLYVKQQFSTRYALAAGGGGVGEECITPGESIGNHRRGFSEVHIQPSIPVNTQEV